MVTLRTLSLLILLFCSSTSVAKSKDLYNLLNIKKSATAQEIKKAYRNKARETHPDKQKSITDPEMAASEFREVVEAFETLSDQNARDIYDRTGQTISQQNSRGGGGGGSSGNGATGNTGGFNNWNWGFHFHFNNFHQQNSGIRYHQYLYDPFRKRQILDSQSRAVQIKPTLEHLRSVVFNDDDNDLLDRYVLIAFFDSSQTDCVNVLTYEALYPWPFAGFTQEGSHGIWWEEYIMPLKIDMNPNSGSDGRKRRELANYFDLALSDDGALPRHMCPSFSIIPRGGSLDDRISAVHYSNSEDFRSWVWQYLKMQVSIVNRTPWILHRCVCPK